ncbi:MAG: DUF5060 domain-containing protein, partial [Verrucomicrobia bacterium]|nr:DUF5060 domain-containing protein [Verrucomicrobiota bacterium]
MSSWWWTGRRFLWLLCVAAGPGLPPPAPAAVSPSLGDNLLLKAVGPSKTSRHEPIEFVIENDHLYANPCDPVEVEAGLELTTPSGLKLSVPAFYHQPCEWRYVDRNGRQSEWIYPVGQPGWRARFAPDEIGRYTAAAVVKDGQGLRRSGPVAFECGSGPSKGYVRVSRRDARFFELGDGSPLFPIGQNLAFIGESQYLDTEKAARVFRKLAENGANFARVWACAEDWGMAIEARKSAWGRSWSWKPPFVPLPGDDPRDTNHVCVGLGGAKPTNAVVSPSHPVALRPGVAYQLTGRVRTEPETGLRIELAQGSLGEAVSSDATGQWKRFERTFTTGKDQWWLGDVRLRVTGPGRVWLSDLSLREAGGGAELLWEADPNRPARGVYNQLDSFMLDRIVEAAERHG